MRPFTLSHTRLDAAILIVLAICVSVAHAAKIGGWECTWEKLDHELQPTVESKIEKGKEDYTLQAWQNELIHVRPKCTDQSFFGPANHLSIVVHTEPVMGQTFSEQTVQIFGSFDPSKEDSAPVIMVGGAKNLRLSIVNPKYIQNAIDQKLVPFVDQEKRAKVDKNVYMAEAATYKIGGSENGNIMHGVPSCTLVINRNALIVDNPNGQEFTIARSDDPSMYTLDTFRHKMRMPQHFKVYDVLSSRVPMPREPLQDWYKAAIPVFARDFYIDNEAVWRPRSDLLAVDPSMVVGPVVGPFNPSAAEALARLHGPIDVNSNRRNRVREMPDPNEQPDQSLSHVVIPQRGMPTGADDSNAAPATSRQTDKIRNMPV